MSKTRNNHYVPQWHQEEFFEENRNVLAYLDLTPEQKVLADGRTITFNAFEHRPTSLSFMQRDLYSTFFGASVNDEIERKMFGDIDRAGSQAVRAFHGDDVSEWHRHFQTLFQYVDIQKIRTPKGLDWLRRHYPNPSQNELMFEMQGIRALHCTIWTEGVREIVSAEDSDVKFILSDHPVTVYNHACPPDTPLCAYPDDPSIALKASQTIFPLSRNYCLILSNLEYAQNPSTKPLEKRTFARNFRQSMVRTDAFIRTRKFRPFEVLRVNRIIKARAKRYVAAGRREWLFPEDQSSEPWEEIAPTLLPPKEELWHFGGEMYAKFADGRVYYQDQFGRTEKERDFLFKERPGPASSKHLCGCGSGRAFGECCEKKPTSLRPSWNELSIRERNIRLYIGITKILGLENAKDWTEVRRGITDDKIRDVYFLYQALWPLETDLPNLLPKPDGEPRTVFTGLIHPTTIAQIAFAGALYFGTVLMQHPFLHAGTVQPKFSPVANPSAYRQEFLKDILVFLKLFPLIDLGYISLFPDPCIFDAHLQRQMFRMAELRNTQNPLYDRMEHERLEKLAEEDTKRMILSFPDRVLRNQLLKFKPDMDDALLDQTIAYIQRSKESDPLAILQAADSVPGQGPEAGLLNLMKMTPNFEIAIYLAQLTGSSVLTDSAYRWREIQNAILTKRARLPNLSSKFNSATFKVPTTIAEVVDLLAEGTTATYPILLADICKYLLKTNSGGHQKPNVEDNLAARFSRLHSGAQTALERKVNGPLSTQITAAFPSGGVQHNNVNRLLLMSGSEHHLSSVPMAFRITHTL
ncbi:DUF4238 domain-containing protein [Bradyrhizobium manausense]|uniref:DUF4238 domain-containing protein n=1 Tax=Bradyrhizobium manausense TaxID=989370 RepID=A0A0R3D0Y4_9BRAD|nr:DUF4238 domain-containing protein [Bradyrhizobium manausense]KRQ03497.1 hypothetical protein AOQ71_32875 [Bradyrhizobium manausense]